MSSQKVTDKILADAKEEAKQILAQLEKEADNIKNEYAKRIAQKKAQNDREIDETIKTATMRALSQKRLDLNKDITEHKQKIIKAVIQEAITQLIGHKEYADFLKTLVKRSNEKEGDLLLSSADAKRYRNELEKYIQAEGLNLKISVDDGLTGGVVIKKEKTNYIGSLDIILELLSDELAIVVSKELF
jgi:V/A-type H+-transporting ATPase subunit E